MQPLPYNNQIIRLRTILESQNLEPSIIENILSEMTKEFMESDKDMPVGVNPLIFNEKGEILLLRRANSFGAGTYCLPGGHLKTDENFEEGLVRECKEELGITVKIEDVEIINLADCLSSKHQLQIGGLIKKYEGTPQITEPTKADDIGFFPLDTPPTLFFGTKTNIDLYKLNKFYDTSCNYYQKK